MEVRPPFADKGVIVATAQVDHRGVEHRIETGRSPRLVANGLEYLRGALPPADQPRGECGTFVPCDHRADRRVVIWARRFNGV